MNIKVAENAAAVQAPARASEDDLLASMMGAVDTSPAPAAAKKDRPADAPSRTAQQGDRQAARPSPGGGQPDEDDLLVDGNDDENDDDANEDDDILDDAVNDDEGEDAVLDDDDADHEGDEEGEGDDFDATKLGDDVKLSVTVDGEEKEVTLGELKSRYAGEGAIEKRLQQATEARTSALKDYEKGQQVVTHTLQTLGAAIFRRVVPAPSEQLRASDPTRYLLQKEAYDAETQAIQQQQDQIQGAIAQMEADQREREIAIRQQAATDLRRMMPVLAHPEKGPKVRTALIEAAKEIGYTEAQIAACVDPLMFKTVMLAARELRRQKGLKVSPVKEKVRTLAARGSQNKASSVADPKRRERKTIEKARRDPSEANLLDTLIVTKPKPRRR